MITEIYLFTNRNTIFFDEKGEQICDLQRQLSWEPTPSYHDESDHTALRRIMKDKPTIYIARWQEWKNEITMDEFCCLLGYGPWYWDEKAEMRELQKQQEQQEPALPEYKPTQELPL